MRQIWKILMSATALLNETADLINDKSFNH